MFGPIARAARAAATTSTLQKIAAKGPDSTPVRDRAANLGKFLHKKKAPSLADQLTSLRASGAFRQVSRGTSTR